MNKEKKKYLLTGYKIENFTRNKNRLNGIRALINWIDVMMRIQSDVNAPIDYQATLHRLHAILNRGYYWESEREFLNTVRAMYHGKERSTYFQNNDPFGD